MAALPHAGLQRIWGSRSLLDPLPAEDWSEEHRRLKAADDGTEAWRKWGPYLSERQWGTCREDYGTSGNSWAYFPFDVAHQVAYRWGEDGLAGVSDDNQHLCMSLALWNGRDPILKERIFGLSNPQGNHGEDSKDMYYYLDATPTHSYMKILYKYPQSAFPYDKVRRETAVLGALDGEYELMHTGIFDQDRYFDVYVEYGREGVDDIYMKVEAHNRGPDAADLHVLPQVFFRNTWSWGCEDHAKPTAERKTANRVDLKHAALGEMFFYAEGAEVCLICDNETNCAALDGDDAGLRPMDYAGDSKPPQPPGAADEGAGAAGEGTAAVEVPGLGEAAGEGEGDKSLPFAPAARTPCKPQMYQASGKNGHGPYKDAFNRYVIKGDRSAAEAAVGTKAAFHIKSVIPAGASKVFKVLLSSKRREDKDPFKDFDATMSARRCEADEFYGVLQSSIADDELKRVQRQALAGMIWTKQFYMYDINKFFEGDPHCQKTPEEERRAIRNSDWDHMDNRDIISMPDKWEFPWYATWDLAFHMIPFALVDPGFAKSQLRLFTSERFMHPNGQLPAFEWNFSDVNPPVHAWAAWRVFQMDRKARQDAGDLTFLEEIFHKLMMNFTWWVNRKDAEGRNIFQGGFLGLDNIGVFDRGGQLPTGGIISQSDGTSWMAFYSLTLMRMALELALHNSVYESMACKFLEHFLLIARAMTKMTTGQGLWDEADEFYYDVLTLPSSKDNLKGKRIPLKVRSMVGLIPLFAVEVLEPSLLEKVPNFAARANHLFTKRKDLAGLVSDFDVPGYGRRRLLSLLRGTRMKCLLKRMLDPEEFLSDYGVRALSRYHLAHPYVLECEGSTYKIGYEAGESSVCIMGGNSNWRGPIWYPMNYLIIESLQKFHQYYGDAYKVECPTGSGNHMHILGVADTIRDRLVNLFMPSEDGKGRPALRVHDKMATDPHFRDNILFYEHFHGDSGRGLGASHQTGWTGLVAKLIQAKGMGEGADASPRRL